MDICWDINQMWRIYMYLHVFARDYMYLHVLTCIYMYSQVCTCMYMYVHVYLCIYWIWFEWNIHGDVWIPRTYMSPEYVMNFMPLESKHSGRIGLDEWMTIIHVGNWPIFWLWHIIGVDRYTNGDIPHIAGIWYALDGFYLVNLGLFSGKWILYDLMCMYIYIWVSIVPQNVWFKMDHAI